LRKILSSMGKADETYGLIESGDRIAVGVSGGKDSLVLLKALAAYKMYIKKDFELISLTVDLGFDGFDTSGIEEFASDLNIKHRTVRTDIGKIVFDVRQESNPCALCAKMRKGALYTAALEEGCNKAAFAHHVDDAIETFFMSMMYEGRINTFAPVTHMSRRDVTIIRPLIFLPEKHALAVARQKELPILPPHCDIAGSTKREEARRLIEHLATIVPDIETKLLHALIHTETYGLWDRMKLPKGVQAIETAEGGKVVPIEDSQTVSNPDCESCGIL